MKKIILILVSLLTISFANASDVENQQLVDLVKSKLDVISHKGAVQVTSQLGWIVVSISIDQNSIKCSAHQSYDLGLVGSCTATGDLDYPNSSSIFSISVSDKEEGSEERAFKVTWLTSEL